MYAVTPKIMIEFELNLGHRGDLEANFDLGVTLRDFSVTLTVCGGNGH